MTTLRRAPFQTDGANQASVRSIWGALRAIYGALGQSPLTPPAASGIGARASERGGWPRECWPTPLLRALFDALWPLVRAPPFSLARTPVAQPGRLVPAPRLRRRAGRVAAEHNAEIGDWLVQGLRSRAGKGGAVDPWTLWAIGRLGARAPLYGNAHGLVATETATAWPDALLALDWKRVDGAAAAAANIARRSGDRARDLPPELADRVITRVRACGAPAAWIERVRAC